MARHLIETYKWSPTRLQVIAPGVDMQWNYAGSISTERLQALSRLWRLPEHATVVVMPMPFVAGGGHRVLLEALKQITRPDYFAVLVGDNRPDKTVRDEIVEAVTTLGLDGKVIMPDFCLDWPAACWLSNIVVAVNTEARGQANELLVAQAIGRPVVISTCGANPEFVEVGETAWAVPPNDSTELSRTLREVMMVDNARRLDLTHRTRGFVSKAFPQADWFNSMMDLYDSLLLPEKRRAQAAA